MIDKPFKFSQDVYNKSWEDFKVFAKGKHPKATIKVLKQVYKDGYNNSSRGKITPVNK